MNKQAILSGGIFVILVFLSFSSVIFIFLTHSNSANSEIIDIRKYEFVYSEKSQIDFYLKQIQEQILYQIYEEIINNDKYILEPIITNSNSEVFFENYNLEWKKEFEKKYREKLIDYFSNLETKKSFFKNLKLKILDNNFETEFNKNCLILKINKINLNYKSDELEINYFPEIKIKTNITEKGLADFREIYEFKEKCVNFENINEQKKCYENNKNILNNFDLILEEKIDSLNKKYLLIKLKSKKEFYFNNEFKKIEFSFIPK